MNSAKTEMSLEEDLEPQMRMPSQFPLDCSCVRQWAVTPDKSVHSPNHGEIYDKIKLS